ncbi:MAG: pilus assembly PilX N-terminal domain-containing protein [Deltaproteobacteria bacterium]|nr:pilus assembly PilX N-terminal domain-containing protein [Deltaproteobacteria bacterium]
MKNRKQQEGMALVLCLLIMAVAAMIAVGIATDSSVDSQISRNQRLQGKDFFVADGTNQIEVPRISMPNELPVPDITNPVTLENDAVDETLPSLPQTIIDPPTYRALIRYHYYRPTLAAGYSFNMFNSYYYSTMTRTRRNNLNKTAVRTVQSKIGPKL